MPDRHDECTACCKYVGSSGDICGERRGYPAHVMYVLGRVIFRPEEPPLNTLRSHPFTLEKENAQR
jgi:hypothetical protein